jgi:hypothetical protein
MAILRSPPPFREAPFIEINALLTIICAKAISNINAEAVGVFNCQER